MRRVGHQAARPRAGAGVLWAGFVVAVGWGAAVRAAGAPVPAPTETPVEIVVSGRTSTLKRITIMETNQAIPPNYSAGRVRNTPGFRWYVSRHYAIKTDMPARWAHDCLTWSELAWPHLLRVIGRTPGGIDRKRMVLVYGKSLASMRNATMTDGGFRWSQSGGGVTFDFLRAAYNYPSGSLTYHKRDLVIHENLHLLQACVTGSCYHMPFRFLEGVTYALANHVYDRDNKRLTVCVLDKPTTNNPYDKALREMARRFRTIREFVDGDKRTLTGPLVGLYTQFMWTDPDRLMKWRLWRDELMALGGKDLQANDRRLMEAIYGDLDRLNDDWRRWVAARRSTFHYVDWGWEQVGDTLWSYGWPQKTPFSQTNVNLPLDEKAVHDPLRMDYPPAGAREQLVGPVRRGSNTPTVGALLDFSRNPGKGLCGLAFGVEDKLPPTQVNVYLLRGRTLVIDGEKLRLTKTSRAVPDALQAAMKADRHRAGLTVTIASKAIRAELRAGAKGATVRFGASLALTPSARRRLLAGPSAVIAKDGYHGVTPLFDAARRPAPDLSRPAPANRWRFAGEEQTYRLVRAEWLLGKAAPASLRALANRMVAAMDGDTKAQRAAMARHAASLPGALRDVRATGAPRASAAAELLAGRGAVLPTTRPKQDP